MTPESHFLFPPFRLDLANQQLWRGTQLVRLRPKAFAVLHYLVTHAHRLVTQEELRRAVWTDTVISEGLLRAYMRELRAVLEDEAQAPRFLETVHGQGYRFVAPVTTAPPVSGSKFQVSSSKLEGQPQHGVVSGSQLETWNVKLETPLVGRETELTQLHGWLEKALQGERQLVFVTGEPGIGKTSLVEAFLAHLVSRPEPAPEHEHEHELWIARGQCVEHHGAGEAYLPILEALGRLCRTAAGEQCKQLLRQQAPTWLVQMPALLEEAELEAVQRKVLGATPERMARELAEAIETLTAERPLVLWVEDLQWSDVSTLDLLLYLAQRRGPARLLVIGTYRPADVIVSGHPLRALKQELQGHGRCVELPLRVLSVAEVTQYLNRRFRLVPSPLAGEGEDGGYQHDLTPPHPGSFDWAQDRPLLPGERETAALAGTLQALGRLIYQRTDGNPLFMVTLVDHLVAQGVIREVGGQWQLQAGIEEVARDVPSNLRQLIEKQLEGLDKDEQRMLATASVVGREFSAAAVAVALDRGTLQVEEGCAALAQRQLFVVPSGGRVAVERRQTGRYQFRHAFYQQTLYEGLTPLRQRQLHQRIGEWKEVAYGKRVGEIAAELAVHFEQGRDYQRAVQYYGQAAQNALQRYAYREAIAHLTKGLELLGLLPETSERAPHELKLQMTLGSALSVASGFADPAVNHAYARARELCRHLGNTPHLFPVLSGLSAFYVARAELRTASELGEQLFAIAQRSQDPALLAQACVRLGLPLYVQGELALARKYLEQGRALYDMQQHRALAFSYGQDPGAMSRCYLAVTLWCLGYPTQALKQIQEGLGLAQELAHPNTLAYVQYTATALSALYREGRATQEQAEMLIALSREHGFSHWLARGTIYRGWAVAVQGQGEEGIAQMRQGLVAAQATGAELWWPYFLALLADVYGKFGQAEEGLALVTEALSMMDKTRERIAESELYRLKGELTLQQFNVQGSKFKVEESPKSEVRSRKSKQVSGKSKASLKQVKSKSQASLRQGTDKSKTSLKQV